ncbi:hypothetical protein EVAR_59792_1 [Eumeta japonica]|uniref:Uncharacterized protein n=1 Tax=Eumeta variegata TaxID=151549 RepID=A0A4C1YC37_EUMVA|nr:hypothetical protein EVAR_59792_1 [Eumeta japonica]
MVCERGSMDMSGEGGGAGAALQQRWYESRVNGSPAAAADVSAEVNGDGFFHSPLEGAHHSRARYYHQQMHAPYSPSVTSHVVGDSLSFLYKATEGGSLLTLKMSTFCILEVDTYIFRDRIQPRTRCHRPARATLLSCRESFRRSAAGRPRRVARPRRSVSAAQIALAAVALLYILTTRRGGREPFLSGCVARGHFGVRAAAGPGSDPVIRDVYARGPAAPRRPPPAAAVFGSFVNFPYRVSFECHEAASCRSPIVSGLSKFICRQFQDFKAPIEHVFVPYHIGRVNTADSEEIDAIKKSPPSKAVVTRARNFGRSRELNIVLARTELCRRRPTRVPNSAVINRKAANHDLGVERPYRGRVILIQMFHGTIPDRDTISFEPTLFELIETRGRLLAVTIHLTSHREELRQREREKKKQARPRARTLLNHFDFHASREPGRWAVCKIEMILWGRSESSTEKLSFSINTITAGLTLKKKIYIF